METLRITSPKLTQVAIEGYGALGYVVSCSLYHLGVNQKLLVALRSCAQMAEISGQ